MAARRSESSSLRSRRLQRWGSGGATLAPGRVAGAAGATPPPSAWAPIRADGTRPGTSRHPDSRDERRRDRRTRRRNSSARRQDRPGEHIRHRRCGRTGPRCAETTQLDPTVPGSPVVRVTAPGRPGRQRWLGRAVAVGSDSPRGESSRQRPRRVLSHLTPASAPARARTNSSRDQSPQPLWPTFPP